MTKLTFAPPDLGTVLFLPELPGGSNKIQDRSYYANVGTITGATWIRLPSGLWVLDFDGLDDKVNLGTSPTLRGSNNNTISLTAWINMDAYGYYPTIIGRHDSIGTDKYLFAVTDANLLAFFASTGAWKSSTFTPSLGVWHHVAVSINAGNGAFYANGVPAGIFSSVSWGTYDAAKSTYLAYAGINTYFNGKIALVGVYNRALNALEVRTRFDREKHLFGVW